MGALGELFARFVHCRPVVGVNTAGPVGQVVDGAAEVVNVAVVLDFLPVTHGGVFVAETADGNREVARFGQLRHARNQVQPGGHTCVVGVAVDQAPGFVHQNKNVDVATCSRAG